MDIRLAEPEDFAACAAISPAVQSGHVWQLRLAYDPTAQQPVDELGAMLQLSRLPRPIVLQPSSVESLEALWSRAADVLVAEDEGGISGYIVLTIEPHNPSATIARLVVTPLLRRAGIGGQLVQVARQWGRAAGVDRLLAHCSARNHPAASFYMRYGFRFAGYSEAFYARNEVALFWQRPV
jgi:GNAT superfamily N-acetyltransferase